MAGNDGRRRPQRISCRGGSEQRSQGTGAFPATRSTANRTDASAVIAPHGKIRFEKNDTVVSLLTAICRDRTTLTSRTLKNRAWRQIGPAADWFRELCW